MERYTLAAPGNIKTNITSRLLQRITADLDFLQNDVQRFSLFRVGMEFVVINGDIDGDSLNHSRHLNLFMKTKFNFVIGFLTTSRWIKDRSFVHNFQLREPMTSHAHLSFSFDRCAIDGGNLISRSERSIFGCRSVVEHLRLCDK